MKLRLAAAAAALLLAAAPAALAQAPAATPATARPSDVASIDAVVLSLYDVISGDAGQPRDWNRFRSLFWPGAVMMSTHDDKDGHFVGKLFTPDDYVTRDAPYFAKHAFFEREVARRTEAYGAIAHVFTTYESRDARDAAKPFERGINSIELVNDGQRWWITAIEWSGESSFHPLPEKYLTSPK